MYSIRYLTSKSFWQLLATNVYFAFTALWLFFGAIGSFWKDGLAYGLVAYLAFFLASLLIAFLFSGRPSSVSRKLSASDTTITIQIGDLLDQKGNLIIGVADTFDTSLGEIISPESVQGQFQLRHFPEQKRLDLAIKKELNKVTVTDRDGSKKSGKQNRYPIGTVAMLEADSNRYFLLAYTKMLPELRTDADICMLANALDKCWTEVRNRGQNMPIHIGVVGSRFARIGLSRSLLIQFIVLSFIDAERKKHVTPQFTVHVHQSDAEEIDFNDIAEWLKGISRIG
jgi:hypothetical protein